ncbi:MAG: substrate-binding domain-containing protein [Ekhidna sp.]
MTKQKIRIGGVPEHFNLPVHLAIDEGHFSDLNIDVEWVDFPGGTGYMTQALREGECDLCILLTEGVVTDILNGNPSKIVSGYVKTSLTWGIHTQEDNPLKDHEHVFDKKIAISRLGSGSHLMPIVDALLRDKTIDPSQFVPIKNIDGAITSLNEKETEVFYWEKFTTKPYLASGKMKRIGEFISPWPCFVIAATNEIIESQPELVSSILKVIQSSCSRFMKSKEAISLVEKRFNIESKDAARWYHSTEWNTNGWVSNKMLEGVLYTLKEAEIVDQEVTLTNVIWKRNRKA